MEKFLGNKKVIIRFISLYSLGLVLFLLSWTLGYLFLPDGILRGVGAFGILVNNTAEDSLWSEFAIIFGLNLLGFTFILFGNYILRVNYFAFGYLVPLAWMIIYGLTLGTNSFLIPLDERMAPSFAVFTRSGIYEMMAGVLLAVATNSISANKSISLFSKSEPIPKNERVHLKKEQWIAICISILMLGGAAFWEAYMIVNR